MLTDEQLKQALEALPGERVTKEYIESRITEVVYTGVHHAPTLTICSIILDSGYSVRGESACVDSANFKQEIGEKLAYDSAFNKLWPLFGFLLAEKRYRA